MKIVFTGTESTLKSTLAKAIAKEFSLIYVPEFARTYLEEIAPGTPVDPMPRQDYIRIEEGQLLSQKINGYFTKNTSGIFDTDGTVLYIWKQDKFGEIDAQLLDIPEDVIYFLCHPNVNAGKDPLRVDATRREELHAKYVAVLSALSNPVIQLNQDTLEGRMAKAQQVIRELLNNAV